MGAINVKRLGRAHAETHKRLLPLAFTISLGVICFALGISLIVWAPSTRSKTPVQKKQQQSSGRTNAPESGEIAADHDSNSNRARYAMGGLFLVLAFVFGVLGSLLTPWTLQIRQRGLVYDSVTKKYATSWSEITDLRVYLSKRPTLYYHIQSRTLKKTAIFWLNEADDQELISLLKANVPGITYWKDRSQQVNCDSASSGADI